MKRKLALLLAGTMVLSTVSTNTIFAANGEVTLTNNMIVNVNENDPFTAELTFGDGNQNFTSNSAFTLELENGKWVTTDNADTAIDETDLEDDFEQTFVSSSKYNAVLSNVNIKNPEFKAQYKVTDESAPTYVKITSVNVAGFQEVKRVQLTNPGQTAANNVTVTAATSQNLSYATGGKIVINSDFVGGIDAGDKYTITLPSGYKFDDVYKDNVVVKNSSKEDFKNNTVKLSTDRRTITVTVDSDYEDQDDAAFGGIIEISGLNVNNTTSDYNKDINVTVKKGSKTLAEKKIARFNSYGITAKVTTAEKDMPKINAGVKTAEYTNLDKDGNTTSSSALILDGTAKDDSETAKIKISENIANSFRGGDIIVTLPEGVEITDVVIEDDTEYLNDGDYTFEVDEDDKNILTIKNLAKANANDTDTKPFVLEFSLEIQTPADFDGDVTATVSGGKNTVDVVKEINVGTIATVKSVVGVEAKLSEVKVGYTNQDAADIVISEKEAGVFEDGEVITIKLTDDFGKYVYNYGFTDADVEVTSGDAEIDFEVEDDEIVITIESIDSKNPIELTVKNVEVFSDRNVPTYNGSDAIQYSVTSSENLTVAAEGDYIKFVSELSQDVATAAYNKDVVITLNGTSATLADGTKVDLYGAPYISADGNYMAPVKGFAYALGLQPEDIVFDSEAKIATFFLADGSVAQVQAGNKYATVNGQNLPLIDANGNIVTPVIKEGRFYLPLRACAKTLFGVDVSYNSNDKSVVLNPTK